MLKVCPFYWSLYRHLFSIRAFWKKRPIGQVYRKGHNVMSQTPVVSMTTRLIHFVSNLHKLMLDKLRSKRDL